jgi:iron complex outermembrane receptor protein
VSVIINPASTARSGLRPAYPRRAPIPRTLLGNFLRLNVVTAALVCAASGSLRADTNSARHLADLSLEQLMNETVTSVSKKEQRLGDAAAAIAVLTNDDLQRTGAHSVAEALRWAPGVTVNNVNANQWAISARGFNGLYANKLLVLVDGRAVYTPLFAGVYWDLQQSMLADLDRIEVIRGPGATVWGANAVNGVINIESRSARDTQGGYTYAGGGDINQAFGGGRYGAPLGSNTFFRVFGSYQLTADYPLTAGPDNTDSWRSWHGGFRLDHYADADTHATWQADTTHTDLDHGISHAYNVNTLGRWRRQWSDRSTVELQGYYDRTHRDEITRARSLMDTLDVTAQHTFGLGERHDVIWGLGYRYINNQTIANNAQVQVLDRNFDLQLVSAFLQDEVQLLPDALTLTLGTKLEHNDFTGWEVQPSVRLMFKPAERHTLWAAVSRAVRTPSEIEGLNLAAIPYGTPVLGFQPTIFGNPNARAETLWAYELGYRCQLANRVNVDLSTFYNDYDRVLAVGPITQFIPGAPGIAVLPFDNYHYGNTFGGEAAVTLDVTESWRVLASYSLLVASIRGPAGSDPETAEESAPRNQLQLRSSYNFSRHLSLAIQARYVDGIRYVPSYLTADFQITYRIGAGWELAVGGRNLLDKQHAEHGLEPLATPAEVPRSFFGKVTCRF